MKKILLILLSIILSSSGSVKYKLTQDQNKIIRQAKSLRKNGLVEESKNIYNKDYYFSLNLESKQ